jgi:hypothetical protein
LDDEWVKVIITEVEKMYISTKAEVIQQKMSLGTQGGQGTETGIQLGSKRAKMDNRIA